MESRWGNVLVIEQLLSTKRQGLARSVLVQREEEGRRFGVSGLEVSLVGTHRGLMAGRIYRIGANPESEAWAASCRPARFGLGS